MHSSARTIPFKTITLRRILGTGHASPAAIPPFATHSSLTTNFVLRFGQHHHRCDSKKGLGYAQQRTYDIVESHNTKDSRQSPQSRSLRRTESSHQTRARRVNVGVLDGTLLTMLGIGIIPLTHASQTFALLGLHNVTQVNLEAER